MTTISTNRDSERFIVRLPDGMRDRIRVAAEANNRSMNAEIVAALEEKFPTPRRKSAEEILASVEEALAGYQGAQDEDLADYEKVDRARLEQIRDIMTQRIASKPRR